jgi:capsular exopolysaccharide synthesis family protein
MPAIQEPRPFHFDAGDVPTLPWNPDIVSLPTLGHRGTAIEQFRVLRTRILALRGSKPLKTILICSGKPEEGKSFITANLAVSLARNHANRVLLIDGDLRRPTLHTLLGTPHAPGLAEFLAGTVQLRDILQRGTIRPDEDSSRPSLLSSLTFIPSGRCSNQAEDLVAAPRMEELIAAVSAEFDWILIDSAPVLAVSDALQMSRAVDGILLVARSGHTPYVVAKQTQAALDGAHIIGVVLNDVPESSRGPNPYYEYNLESDAEQGTTIGS